MNDQINNAASMPVLIPMEIDQFWERLRRVVREEINKEKSCFSQLLETPGLKYKPLLKNKRSV